MTQLRGTVVRAVTRTYAVFGLLLLFFGQYKRECVSPIITQRDATPRWLAALPRKKSIRNGGGHLRGRHLLFSLRSAQSVRNAHCTDGSTTPCAAMRTEEAVQRYREIRLRNWKPLVFANFVWVREKLRGLASLTCGLVRGQITSPVAWLALSGFVSHVKRDKQTDDSIGGYAAGRRLIAS